jgi:hypothetical protein
MSEWLGYAVILSYVMTYILQAWIEKEHKKEIDRIHESYREEREELLDRIMSNNVHEFKAVTQQADVKRSSSGNYLIDRMKTTVANKYTEE